MLPNFDGSQLCAQVDPELWFPEGGFNKNHQRAIEICRECVFIDECYEYALQNDVQGIWGATTYQQRKVVRKTLGIKAIPVVWDLSQNPEAVKARQRRAKLRELQEDKENE